MSTEVCVCVRVYVFYGVQPSEHCRQALDKFSQLKMRGAKSIGLTLESCLCGYKIHLESLTLESLTLESLILESLTLEEPHPRRASPWKSLTLESLTLEQPHPRKASP